MSDFDSVRLWGKYEFQQSDFEMSHLFSLVRSTSTVLETCFICESNDRSWFFTVVLEPKVIPSQSNYIARQRLPEALRSNDNFV